MTTLSSVISRGLVSALPAAGIPGRLYFASDTNATYRDNGTTWDQVGTGGGLAAVNETPAGAMNGVNTSFALSFTPNPSASVIVTLNDLVQGPGDISVSGPTITYAVAPKSTDVMRAWYTH